MKLNEEPRLPETSVKDLQWQLTKILRELIRQTNALTDGTQFYNIVGASLDLAITPKAPGYTEDGGTLKLLGQDATGITKNGGGVWIVSGNGKLGGDITVSAGSGVGVASTGGSFFMNGGAGVAFGGDVNIAPGSGPTAGSTRLSGGNTGVDGVTITDNGTATQVAFFGVTPVAQPTTSTASSTFVANTGTAINSASTFDGYTIAKVVKALRNLGILA